MTTYSISFQQFSQLCTRRYGLGTNQHKMTHYKSNTILGSASSLLTFLVSLAFLGEFTWVKLISVLLCMRKTIILNLGDSETGLKVTASNPVLGDILALVSVALYAIHITLIRKKLPDYDDKRSGEASMAQYLGFLGFFNLFIFLHVATILNFTKLEPFYKLTWKQVGLIVGKDSTSVNMLSQGSSKMLSISINALILIIIEGQNSIQKLIT